MRAAPDLVVEIEGIRCIVTYTPAPLALRHPELRAGFPRIFFAAAAAAKELCKGQHPGFPRREVKSMRSQETKNFHYLDVLGATGNLSIDRQVP